MIQLNSDFHLTRYGVDTRLVVESDAEFILSLRTNTFLTRFIHSTDNNLENQIEWIRKYKEREREGREYYFIYSKNDEPMGLSRVYNIFEYYGTGGSWLCKPNNGPKDSLATYLIMHDIMFQDLGLDLSIFDVRKENKKVWRLHESFGAKRIGESEIDYYFALFKNDYFENKKSFEVMIG